MRIGITHDAGPNEECALAARALGAMGEVALLAADEALAGRLSHHQPAIVFNLVRGAADPAQRLHVTTFLERAGIPFSGSDTVTHATCGERPRMKGVLAAHGVPTAGFAVLESLHQVGYFARRAFPVAIQRTRGVSSCFATLVAHDFDELEAIATELLAASNEPILIERFLPGESFACGILGNGIDTVMLPVVSIPNDPFSALAPGGGARPARIADGLAEEIQSIALRAFLALGCRDLARVDIRLSDAGVPNVCAVDPLPTFDADDASTLLTAARAAGLEQEELVQRCLLLAARRVGLDVPRAPQLTHLPRRSTPPRGMYIRPSSA